MVLALLRRRPHAPFLRTLSVVALIGLVCLASGIAFADVPTARDVAACNQEAREGTRGRTTFPNRKDEAGAADARKVPATSDAPAASGRATQSPDAQIEGMDPEGAKDAAYRAAYRSCMRRSGF